MRQKYPSRPKLIVIFKTFQVFSSVINSKKIIALKEKTMNPAFHETNLFISWFGRKTAYPNSFCEKHLPKKYFVFFLNRLAPSRKLLAWKGSSNFDPTNLRSL